MVNIMESVIIRRILITDRFCSSIFFGVEVSIVVDRRGDYEILCYRFQLFVLLIVVAACRF